ncbi:hypothetical protein [Teichococcus oryzae]|uniref:Uncharacterized protein n=1 Tax=Teichococcus oryzae TaxID=1608942 RepID=A0A5B2TFQ1_9PROT|nr:hypothetical protein [Pseudoroseomonas oryzae]KAA2212825.1 hypothetical protein F0Q34_11865 [Pseudoroseomonas oryzae]
MNSHRVSYATFDHFDEFAASLPGTSLIVTPFALPPFSAQTTLLRFDEMVVTTGRATPLMFTGSLSAGSARLVLPLEKTQALRLNGLMVQTGDVAVFGAGTSYDGAGCHGVNWASLVLPSETLQPLLKGSCQSSLRRAGAHAVLHASPRNWAEATSLLTAAAQIGLEDPQALTVAEAMRGLRADLLEALRELLATARQSDAARSKAIVQGRQHIVRAVEDLLKAEGGEIRSAKDLCTAIDVTPKRLRAAIEMSFGIGPEHYLELRRLAMECAVPGIVPRHPSTPE